MGVYPIRTAVGALVALVAAATLTWSIAKPPSWNPTFFGLTPRGLGSRDRVRTYAVTALILGAAVAIYFGLMAR